MKKNLFFLFISFLFISSCGSIKSTIKNVDDTVMKPLVKENHFLLSEYSTDSKYGYHADYPINIGFDNEKNSSKNISLYFNALEGTDDKKFTYQKVETCCPFPTKKTKIGAGTLDIYEITFEKSSKKVRLYFNIFEKGKIHCPMGFSLKTF